MPALLAQSVTFKAPKKLSELPAALKAQALEVAKAKLPPWFIPLADEAGKLSSAEDVIKIIATS